MATLTMDLVIGLIANTLFTAFFYPIVGLKMEWTTVIVFWAVTFMLRMCGESVGLMALTVLYDPLVANLAGSLTLGFVSLVSNGVFRATANVPWVLRAIGYASFQRYSAEILVVNEFQDLSFTCPGDVHDASCPFPTGMDFIDAYYDGAVGRYDINWVILLSLTVVMRGLVYSCLKYKSPMLR
eukprot:GFYU01002352.1.p1 GENE.GFYU01002352.1~~GFYU01002352.1.p1  ORF type:complete len:183 (-),score=36.44 GFYU01002352.1:132-680(-)